MTKTLPFLFALGLCLVARSAAAQVTLSITPDELPAQAGATATVKVSVNIAVRGGLGAPRPSFTMNWAAGTLTPVSITGGEQGHMDFIFLIDPNQEGRAIGEAVYTFTVGENPRAQEVRISVDGGQIGMTDSSIPRQASATLRLLPVSGSGIASPSAPPTGSETSTPLPPATSTDSPSTPDAPILGIPGTPGGGGINVDEGDRLPVIETIVILIALGGGGLLVGKLRSKPTARATSPTSARTTPPPAAAKSQEVPTPPLPKEEKRPPAGFAIHVYRRPTPQVMVAGNVYDYRGDGQQVVDLAVSVVPSPGWSATFHPFDDGRSQASAYPYERWKKSEEDSWLTVTRAAGADTRHLTLQVPWEWEDRGVSVSLPALPFELVANTGAERQQHVARPEPITLRIQGAAPRIRLNTSRLQLDGTGRDSTQLDAELWLFSEPATTESVSIASTRSNIGQHQHDRLSLRDGTWTAPFLVTDATPASDYVEVIPITASCQWTGGVLYQRATEPRRSQPLTSDRIDIQVAPCALDGAAGAPEGEKATPQFCPVRGARLFAEARLIDAHNHQVQNPFAIDAVHSEKARITCEVRDLSQGQVLPRPHGCKIPPRGAFDQATHEDEAQALIDRTEPVAPARFVHVSGEGLLHTDGLTRSIHVWDYTVRDGCEPVHNGPVVYRLVVEDGFGGKAMRQGLCRALLGSLVIETGGPEFPMYEHTAAKLEVQYDPSWAPYQAKPDELLHLTWDFAVVNETGDPVCSANAGRPVQHRVHLEHRLGSLYFFRMPADREVFVGRATGLEPGKVRLLTTDQAYISPPPPETWRQMTPAQREHSNALRKAWHSLTSHHESKPAVRWIRHDAVPIDWKDWVLPLSVRLELRTSSGDLIATSDRLIAGGAFAGRTPADHVWRDHRFQYVLASLRLLLRDQQDTPYADREYALTVEQSPSVRGRTGRQGEIEMLVPACADHGRLDLFSRIEPAKVDCAFKLDLGYLPSTDEPEGVVGRLDNFGLHARRPPAAQKADQERRQLESQSLVPVSGDDLGQRQRALERFQYFYDVNEDEPSGERTRRVLENVYATGSN